MLGLCLMDLRGEFLSFRSEVEIIADAGISVTPLKANFWHPDGFMVDCRKLIVTGMEDFLWIYD